MGDEPDTRELIGRGDAVSGPVETIAFDASTPGQRGAETAFSAEIPQNFGRYHIRRLLGRGGMGSVYLADDLQLNRQVALKIPRLAGDDGDKFVTRLMREARAVASLRHANICPVFDMGEENGVHYLAMAYIQGRPLSHYLLSSKPQTERAVALTVYKIALALQEAHSVGILHRDLKPANIMIDQKGEPIVMDFGLSYRLQDGEARLTQDGTVIGTPAYMAPEQIDNRCPIGIATDIYALGVVLFELLTRRCPFQGSMVSVIGQVLHAPTPKASDYRRDITPALAAICEKAMSKDAALRYGSMKEFADALAAFMKGKIASAMTETLAPLTELGSLDALLNAPTVQVTAAGTLIQPQPEPAWKAHLPWMIPAAIGGVLLLGLVMYSLRRGGNQPPTTNSPGPPAASTTPAAPPAVTPSPAKPAETSPVSTEAPTPELGGPAPQGGEPTPDFEFEPPAAVPEQTPEEPDPDIVSIPAEFANPPEGPRKPDKGKNIDDEFERADRNHDGKLDPGEAPLHIILRADKNKDGHLDLKEMQQAYARLEDKLFAPPTAAERRRLPPPRGGPGPPPPMPMRKPN